MGLPYNLTGATFGKLVAIKPSGKVGKHITWLCECECGRKTSAYTTNLTRGKTKSCGNQKCKVQPPSVLRPIKKTSYRTTFVDGHRVQRHRLIMEAYLGRKLLKEELVHHRDGNRHNNEISNLEVMSVTQHVRHHLAKHPVFFTCKFCGKLFEPRRGHRGRNPRFCNKKCFGQSKRKSF